MSQVANRLSDDFQYDQLEDMELSGKQYNQNGTIKSLDGEKMQNEEGQEKDKDKQGDEVNGSGGKENDGVGSQLKEEMEMMGMGEEEKLKEMGVQEAMLEGRDALAKGKVCKDGKMPRDDKKGRNPYQKLMSRKMEESEVDPEEARSKAVEVLAKQRQMEAERL
jgi:hypothetical protein